MLNSIFRYVGGHRIRFTYLLLLAIIFGGLGSWRVFGQQASPPAAGGSSSVEPHAASTFTYFSFLSDARFSTGERAALFASLVVAIAALLYAWMLVRQVRD